PPLAAADAEPRTASPHPDLSSRAHEREPRAEATPRHGESSHERERDARANATPLLGGTARAHIEREHAASSHHGESATSRQGLAPRAPSELEPRHTDSVTTVGHGWLRRADAAPNRPS